MDGSVRDINKTAAPSVSCVLAEKIWQQHAKISAIFLFWCWCMNQMFLWWNTMWKLLKYIKIKSFFQVETQTSYDMEFLKISPSVDNSYQNPVKMKLLKVLSYKVFCCLRWDWKGSNCHTTSKVRPNTKELNDY